MRQSIVAAALILCLSAPCLEAADDKPLVLDLWPGTMAPGDNASAIGAVHVRQSVSAPSGRTWGEGQDVRLCSWQHAAKRGAIVGALTAGLPIGLIGLIGVVIDVALYLSNDSFSEAFPRSLLSFVGSRAVAVLFGSAIGALLVGTMASMRRGENPD